MHCRALADSDNFILFFMTASFQEVNQARLVAARTFKIRQEN
jgi:hypothetical protein